MRSALGAWVTGICLVGASCVLMSVPSIAEIIVTPTKRMHISQYPAFVDDLDYVGMETALDRQIQRFRSKRLVNKIKLGDDIFPEEQMLASVLEFRRLIADLRTCQRERQANSDNCIITFQRDFIGRFNIYEPDLRGGDPGFGQEKSSFFTGYNTPTILATTAKTASHKFGIYSRPTTDDHSNLTRNQIDFQRILERTNADIFYADDLFKLYLLHIEGGGKIIVNESHGNHREFYLSYDGTNGQPFKWISTYMVEHGMLDPSDRSIEAQRVFLREHPSKWEEIYSSCPNYVFFKITNTPPHGSDEVPLTDNRSIATDSRLYKSKGLLAFIMARRPIEQQTARVNRKEVQYRDFSRFFIDQDTGGAIKGKARADLYFGEGAYSQLAGENTKEWGKIFFVMKKM